MASYDYRDPRSPASIDEPPPQVAIAGRSWVVPVMVLAALGLGALVFLQLSQGRVRLEQARLTDRRRARHQLSGFAGAGAASGAAYRPARGGAGDCAAAIPGADRHRSCPRG
jgi:hypothetical protein